MRTRKDIEFDFTYNSKGNAPLTDDLKEILECLLDIRELLRDIKSNNKQINGQK